nr:hypothetical protein [Qingshengfaniella alkalisoli]
MRSLSEAAKALIDTSLRGIDPEDAEWGAAGGEGHGVGQSFQITEGLKLPCLVQRR